MEIKRFLPPVVTDFIRRNKKIVRFKNYEDALSSCSNNAYRNEELCNLIADKTSIHITSLKEPFTLNPTTVYLAFSLNYFVNAFGKKNITVLDFGGACGIHYYEVKKILPQTISLKWIVVETSQMVYSAINKKLVNDELSYTTDVENIKEPVDFIYSSSALQYVPTPYNLLKKLVAVKAKMILLNRMMFNKRNYEIITVQRSFFSANGLGKLPAGYSDKLAEYPHTTMSIDKVHLMMTDAGYFCFSDFNESSGSFLLGKEEILGKGLLFILK